MWANSVASVTLPALLVFYLRHMLVRGYHPLTANLSELKTERGARPQTQNSALLLISRDTAFARRISRMYKRRVRKRGGHRRESSRLLLPRLFWSGRRPSCMTGWGPLCLAGRRLCRGGSRFSGSRGFHSSPSKISNSRRTATLPAGRSGCHYTSLNC